MTGFFSFSSAQASIAKAIHAYNTFRPRASVGYLTPSQAYRRSGPLHLKWYPYKKCVLGMYNTALIINALASSQRIIVTYVSVI